MKKWIASLALGLATMALPSAAVLAQTAPAATAAAEPAAAPAVAPAPAPVQAGPNVESIDILKQNQAERTRDQPGNLAPTWRKVVEGETFYASLPYAESGVLIQPKAQFPGQAQAVTAGEAWRQYRNGPLTKIGGWLLIVTLAVIALYFFIKGPLKQHGSTGRKIERFTLVERTAHWTVAISFVVLALSGLTMLFGKYILMPVFGHALFGWLTYGLKTIHNFVGPVFSVAIVVMFILFVKDNFPIRADMTWLMRLGGMFGKSHAPAGRFNAGEKLWFWGGLTLLGLIITATGFVLDHLVPNLVYTRALMQVMSIIHIVATVLMMAAAFGHIYLGTIGMEGAFKAMYEGHVDDQWAKEHHDLWYEQVQRGEVPRVRSEEGAAKPAGPPKTV